MDVMRGLALAFSCFSRIPMPSVEWNDRSMRYMMCFFPLIGVVIGIALGLWMRLCQVLGFGSVLLGAGIALIPVAVTGGIHLDGFCDVVDAQASHASPDRKREIMADPHIGAFAAIAAAGYLLLYTAFASELSASWQVAVLLGGIHVASRALSAVATLAFAGSSDEGMLASQRRAGHGRVQFAVVIAEFAVAVVVMALVSIPAGLGIAAAGVVCLLAVRLFAQRSFGGMSGDVAGFFLQVAELCMLVVLVVATKAVGL